MHLPQRPPPLDGPPLCWVFQPIVDLSRGTVLGHEVLARTPRGSSPFEPGLPAPARRQLEQACLVRSLWELGARTAALPPGHLFLNVSPEAVCAPDFLALLTHPELAPGLLPRLVLELTEREEVADPARLAQQLEALAARGVRIALDDFGAGHSGLLTLVHTRPGFLKLDMALIRGLHRHPYRQHLVRSLVAFAASVGAVLIAEGVEAWEELEVLLALGVHHAQGFLVAPPASLPACPLPAFEAERVRVLSRLAAG